MLPIFYGILRSYAPYVTLPVAVIVGFIGYKLEGLLTDKYTPYQASILEQRSDREAAGNHVDEGTLREHKFVPRTVFERNVSPSLQPTSQ